MYKICANFGGLMMLFLDSFSIMERKLEGAYFRKGFVDDNNLVFWHKRMRFVRF